MMDALICFLFQPRNRYTPPTIWVQLQQTLLSIGRISQILWAKCDLDGVVFQYIVRLEGHSESVMQAKETHPH